MYSISSVISLTQKFIINIGNVDELCYQIYSIFRDNALSMAIDRPLCNRMIIIGKDFELRVYVTTQYEGIISIFMELENNIKQFFNNINNLLSNIYKVLNKICNIEPNIRVTLRKIFRTRNKIDINLIQLKLKNLGIATVSKEEKIIDDLHLKIFHGTIIGKKLKKYDIYITLLQNDNIELGLTVDFRSSYNELYSFLEEANNLMNVIELNVVVNSDING
ncbi:hypothetical protein Igag_1898 [Ignisphaera aggregans DSM 17230]|uniref:Uncharacterized protein n=1 Tax=Ignisphaera aggregans (strain DSM 17230 / JCM 13409 / AQ1.S1) TaxID=583356 RepID=E0ST30_IGNAA|nr:hypothetical protein Igag_1898 [Ignisphaera aggregans DSM 17230]